ncbi:phage tape measure protein [[Actinobacillus] rossii]|uniref:Phage tape measure protein n=1 Tax=[Actinobacillus] rossii TaxID=123820 RepID=A0A380U006_9PAST|nr:phage tape measure protein [[Actinobacillus] rossii]
MSSLGELNIQLALNTVEFQNGLTRAQYKARQFSDRTTQYLNNIEKAANNINRTANLDFWGGNLVSGAKSLVNVADGYTEISNKMNLVSSSSTESAARLQTVFDISLKTNQSVQATSDVYQRFAQNAQALGISQAQVANLTETVSKAVAVSGASVASAQAALMQFGQSLASGVFRGQEFNSVMEQTPALAQAIAHGLGVTTGELRSMANDGKLTMDVLIPALEKAKASVDSQFATRVLTVSAAFENLNTATMKWIGDMDSATGVTQNLASVIQVASEYLSLLAGSTASVAAGWGIGRLKEYISAMREKTTATRNAVVAQATLATANREAAQQAVNLALLQREQARTANEIAVADTLITQRKATLTSAITHEQTALKALNAAKKQSNLLTRGMSNAIGFLGGPVGVVTTALGIGAAAWFDYSQKTEDAHKKALAFANDLPKLREELEKLNSIQLSAEQAKAEESIIAQQKEVDKLSRKITELQKTIANTPKFEVITDDSGFEITIDNAKKLAQLNRTLSTTKADLQVAQEKLNDTQDIGTAISEQLADRTEKMIGFVERYSDLTLTSENRINTWAESASSAVGDFDGLTVSVNGLSGALAKLSGMSITIPSADKVAPQLSDAAKQLIEKSKRQAAISKEKDPNKKAKLRAEDYALSLDKSKFSEYDISQIQAQKEAEYLASEIGGARGKKSKGAGTDYQKQYTDQLTEMQQRLAELNAKAADGQTSQYQEVKKLTQDIATNAEKYKNFGAEGLAKLQSMAAQIDSASQQVAISQFSYDNSERLAAMEFELTLLGKTRSEQELLNYNHQLDIEAAKLKIGMSQENIVKLDEEIAKLKERRAEIEKQNAEYKGNAINGVKEGMSQIEADVTNVAGNISNITVSAFDGMSSAITDLVMTGKADFRSLATSIISDISKMIIKMMLFNAIKQGMSAMGFGFADGGYVGGYAKGGLVGFDDGGFTGFGGKYTPAGIVHKGEYVLTKEATSRIGLNYLNYLNYGTTRGFANGGAVGNVTSYAKSVQSGTTGNVSVKVINNGEPTQADVSTKQNGNELEITVELMQRIARKETNNAIQNNFRAGGVFA